MIVESCLCVPESECGPVGDGLRRIPREVQAVGVDTQLQKKLDLQQIHSQNESMHDAAKMSSANISRT